MTLRVDLARSRMRRLRVLFRLRRAPTIAVTTTRATSNRSSQRTQVMRGAIYEVAGERYTLHHVSRDGVVLRSLKRPCAFLTSRVSGPFDPRLFTPPR